MKSPIAPWIVMVGLLFVGAAHIGWSYAQLPDKVASHFDGTGNPNDWSTKEQFAMYYGVVLVAVAAVFGGIAWLIGHIPPSLVNLPNRQYWLAPERQKQTIRIVSRDLIWFANATILFMIVIMQLIVHANLNPPPELQSGFWIAFGAYMIFVAAWLIGLYWRFRLPKGEKGLK